MNLVISVSVSEALIHAFQLICKTIVILIRAATLWTPIDAILLLGGVIIEHQGIVDRNVIEGVPCHMVLILAPCEVEVV